MTGPRVLTFNFHEPYLCLMAETGFPITVGLYEEGELHRPWHVQFRDVPGNIELVPETEWRPSLEAGKYDVVVAHNEVNAANVFKSPVPGLFVVHNRKSFIESNFPTETAHEIVAYRRLLDRLQERFAFVFISESKRDDYGIPGRVILPGIDVEAYGGYVGDTTGVLRVGNSMRERDLMFDVDFQEAVCEGYPTRVLGVNPGIRGSRPAESYKDLIWHYRHFRCYLHVSREDWEDGYNLAMLEAMACGMPVVSLANPTSPIIDGVNGFSSYDMDKLRDRIQLLLGDRGAALELGAQGRESIANCFPLSRFVEEWRRALDEAAQGQGPRLPMMHTPRLPRYRVLLESVSGPAGPSRFLEWVLRRHHEVVTLGPVSGTAMNLHKERFPHHQITVPGEDPDAALEKLAEADRQLEFCCAVVKSQEYVPALPRATAALPRALWEISAVGTLENRSNDYSQFDQVFFARKSDVDSAREAGLAHVEWLPPACCPELNDQRVEGRRTRLLVLGDAGDATALAEGLASELDIDIDVPGPRSAFQLAKAMAESEVVVYIPREGFPDWDFFQALSSGALVLTAPADGLEDLVEDGRHVIVWRSHDALVNEVKHYIADADSRNRVAEEGRRHVLAHHTYEHRMERLMNALVDTPTTAAARDHRLEEGGYYRSPRPELSIHVPLGVHRLLDVGCGAGDFGRALKAERGVGEVVGIEVVESAWTIANDVLDTAILGNLEEIDIPYPDGHFDCITCGDVLEHLVQPEAALKKLRRVLSDEGVVIASIPNARFYQVVEMLANGRWMYQDAGIMDRTHLRFFTAVEMVELFRRSGFEVQTIAPLSMMRKEALPFSSDGYIQLQKMRIGPLTESEYHDFLVYQYLVIAKKGTGTLLEQAQAHLDKQETEQAFSKAMSAAEQGEDVASSLRIAGKAAARLGRVDEALTAYRESLTRRDDAATRGEYGLVLLAAGRGVDARHELETAHSTLPDDARILSGLGLCELSAGHNEKAFARFRESLEHEFDNEAALEHLVGAAQQVGRLAEAEPYVRRFVEFYPGNLDMCCVHAAVLMELGRANDARARLDNVLLLDPRHKNALALLAQMENGAQPS